MIGSMKNSTMVPRSRVMCLNSLSRIATKEVHISGTHGLEDAALAGRGLGERDEHVLERWQDLARGRLEAGGLQPLQQLAVGDSVIDLGVHRLTEHGRAAAERLAAQPGQRAGRARGLDL